MEAFNRVSNMNLHLTDELRDFVNSRIGDTDLYAITSEYPSDLIRRDWATQSIVNHGKKYSFLSTRTKYIQTNVYN